jgi:hypothetical protein
MGLIVPYESSENIDHAISCLSVSIDALSGAISGVSLYAAHEHRPGYGILCTRHEYQLPETSGTVLSTDTLELVKISEAIRQCALLERAVHAFAYVQSLGRMTERIYAYPVYGSAHRKAIKYDLHIELEKGESIAFTVSDVSSNLDPSDKELRDLLRLGVFSSLVPPTLNRFSPSSRSCYMAVSREHYGFLMNPSRHFLKSGQLSYGLEAEVEGTCIVRIIGGVLHS